MVEVVWTPLAIPGIIALLASVLMSLAIYAANPRRTQNRLLALLLAVEALGLGSVFAVWPLVTSDADAWSLRGIEFSFEIATALLYLAFLGTIESPLSRPFRSALARGVLFAGIGASFLAWPLLSPHILGVGWTDGFHGKLLRENGPFANVVDAGYGLVLLYGLVVALDAWRRAKPGTAGRSQARAYGLAFGVRDLILGTRLTLPIWFPVIFTFETYTFLSMTIGQLAGLALLGYGILKTQLFDIDLKIKWTLKQSTIAAIFVAAFFIVSELAAAIFSDAIGTFAGIIAAGLLVFAMAPLQRLAERVSDRAMPAVDATPAYVAFRKMEVYKAAVEEVLADGAMTEKDRRVLDRLRAQLALTADDARAVERDVTEGGLA